MLTVTPGHSLYKRRLWVSRKNQWSIIHRCERCGTMKSNRIAGDDDERTLIALALKPLSRLPFPIEAIFS